MASALSFAFASASIAPRRASDASRSSASRACGRAALAPRSRRAVVPSAKRKKSRDYDESGAIFDDYDDYDDDSSFGDYGGAGGAYDVGGYASSVPAKKAGGEKGAAKRAKKAKYSEDELPPVAGNVSRIINDRSRRKPEAGAIGSSLDIGNSLDGGDGVGFQSPMDAWRESSRGGPGAFAGDAFADTAAFSMDDDDFGAAGSADDTAYANAAPRVVTVAKEKKEPPKEEEAKPAVDPADAAKGAKKAGATLRKWGFAGDDVNEALSATEGALAEALVEGQTAYNKKRQVAALDWLLLNAPEERIPVDYKNDAIRARA